MSETASSVSEEFRPPSTMVEGEFFLRGLIGAVVLLFVARAAEPLFFGQGFYATLTIYPFWIVVILASVQGGFFVGVATAAAAAMMMDWLPRPAGVDITAHYVELAIVPVQWLLAAVIIGTFRQGQIRSEARLLGENAMLRQMSEDLAAEMMRMDSEIGALELHAASSERDAEVDARPGKAVDGVSESDNPPEAGVAALSALAMAGPDAFEARFAEAAAALGLAGAAIHVGGRVPVKAGAAPDLTEFEAEALRRSAAEARVSETATASGRQVVVAIGDDGFVATFTPCERPSREGTIDDGRSDGTAANAVATEVAPAASAAEAIARTTALAAAIGFSGFRPTIYLVPTPGAGDRRHRA